MRNILRSALMFSAAAFGSAPASAQSALPAGTVKNIVLVHGAFVDENQLERCRVNPDGQGLQGYRSQEPAYVACR